MNRVTKVIMKRILIIGIILSMIGEVLSKKTCSAAVVEYHLIGGTDLIKSLTVSELFLEFQEHSNQVKQIQEKYSLKNIEAQIADQTESQSAVSVARISDSLSAYNKLKSDLENVIHTLQTEYEAYLLSEECDETVILQYESALKEYQSQLYTVNQQISSLNESYYNANAQYYSYVLEADLNQFYITNRELCEQEETNQLLYELYGNLLTLVVLKEQGVYYDCYKIHLETQVQVEKIKLDIGLSTKQKLSTLQAMVVTNDADRNEIDITYESIYTMVCDEIEQKDFNVVIGLDTSKKTYDPAKIIETTLKENTSYLKLKDWIQVYQNYLFSGAYITFLQQQQINELMKDYETQKKLLEKSIERYFTSMIKTYEQCVLDLNAIENYGDSLEQQYEALKKKYQYGRSTLLDMKAMEVQLGENEMKYYQTMIKKMKIDYILEHSLYGITVE